MMCKILYSISQTVSDGHLWELDRSARSSKPPTAPLKDRKHLCGQCLTGGVLVFTRARRQRVDTGCRPLIRRNEGVPHPAALATALDAELELIVLFDRGHARNRAVVNGLQKSAVHLAIFKPGATPASHRHVRHISVHSAPGTSAPRNPNCRATVSS